MHISFLDIHAKIHHNKNKNWLTSVYFTTGYICKLHFHGPILSRTAFLFNKYLAECS